MAVMNESVRQAYIPFSLVGSQGEAFDPDGFSFHKNFGDFLARLQPDDPEEFRQALERREIISAVTPLWNGVRLRFDRKPAAIRMEKSGQGMPDFFDILCSDAARHLIEKFEPGRHQFIHVDVLSPSGKPIGTTNFMNICARLDAINQEKSVLSKASPPNHPFLVFSPPFHGSAEKLVLKKSVIQGHHLWRDSRIEPRYFVSDELAAAIKAAGLKGFKPKRVAESD